MLTEIELLITETLLLHSRYSFSINGLAKKLQENYSRGSYSTVNIRIKDMEKEKKILIRKLGNTTLVNLNFEDFQILRSLYELEGYKVNKIIAEYPFFNEIHNQLSKLFDQSRYSICSSYTRSNLKRNRIELIFITYDIITDTDRQVIARWIMETGIMKNIRIDYFIITMKKFKEYLQTEDFNYVKEVLYNRIVLVHSIDFWNSILPTLSKLENMDLKYDNDYSTETDFTEISDDVIIYNLDRYGYKEFGPSYKIEKKISIEYLIMAILMKQNQRWYESVKVIANRNPAKLDLELLVFLCKKYSLLEKLIEIIKAS